MSAENLVIRDRDGRIINDDAAYEKIDRIRDRLAYLDKLIKRFGWKRI